MLLTNAPAKIPLPFASAGAKNTIPEASQIGIVDGAASLTDGFPPLTRTPLASGGKAPSGLDMNGILYELSAIVRWANAGGGYPFDATFVADSNVGGYPAGARVLRSDGTGYWFNTVDNNTTNPETSGAVAAGWLPDFTTGAATITMTNANVTLTQVQYGKPVIVITGALTANLNLIFPNIVGEWLIINTTTGAFTVTCKTSAGTGIIVNSVQGVAGDGINIYSAVNDAVSTMGELVYTAGGTSDALTITFTPAWRQWANGVPFMVRAGSANATSTPTIGATGLTAQTIVKGNGLALSAGDIAGAGHWLLMQYDSGLGKVVLLNPATGIVGKGMNFSATVSYSATASQPVGDFGKCVLLTGSSAITLTLPSFAGMPAGTTLTYVNFTGAVCTLSSTLNFQGCGYGPTTALPIGPAMALQIVYDGTSLDITSVSSNSLGWGQSYQNVTGTRALNTNYTNSTNRPIYVDVQGTATSAAPGIGAIIAGVTLPTLGGTASSQTLSKSFLVPAGAVYQITGTNITLSNWCELR